MPDWSRTNTITPTDRMGLEPSRGYASRRRFDFALSCRAVVTTRRGAQRARSAAERCKNLYVFVRARLGDEISDREVARRWGMEWKSFVALKHGRRQMPRLEDLEKLAGVLDVDPALVFQVARGVPAAEILGIVAREHRWRALLERVTDAIFTVDAHGRLQDVNDRFSRLVGQRSDELLRRPLLDLVVPDSAPRLLFLLAAVAREGHAHTADVAIHDAYGKERLVDLHAARIVDASGAAIGAQMLARDVTDERRIVRELDAERRLLQTVFDHVPAACILFRRDGTILSANPRVEHVCAFTAPELVGRNALEVFGDPGAAACPVTRAFLTGATEQQVSRLQNRAGTSIYVHRTAGPIVENGVVTRVIEILVDVTAQIEAGDLRLLALCDPPALGAVEQPERRALPRVSTSFPASYSHGDRRSGATVTSLGPGGLFLQVHDERVAIGDEIDVEWQLPGDDAVVRARGVIVWARAAAGDRAGGVGVKFTAGSPGFAAAPLKRSS